MRGFALILVVFCLGIAPSLAESEEEVEYGATVGAPGIQLSVSPDVFDEDGLSGVSEVMIELDASGVSEQILPRNSSCFLALFSPASADFRYTPPVRWASCDASAEFVETGVAQIPVRPMNALANYSLAVFPCGPPSSWATVPPCEPTAYRRNVLRPARVDFPWRPRVLPSSTGDGYRVVWTQRTASSPWLETSMKSENGPWERTQATLDTPYERADLCYWPASGMGWFPPGARLSAEFPSSVKAGGKAVWYRLVEEGGEASKDTPMPLEFGNGSAPAPTPQPYSLSASTSPVGHFRPPPAKGASSAKVVIVGDIGRGPAPGDRTHTWRQYAEKAINTTRRLAAAAAAGAGDPGSGSRWWWDGSGGVPVPNVHKNDDFDAVVGIGDISYSTGYGAVQHEWARDFAPVGARRLFAINLGNHESDAMNVDLERLGRPTTSPYNWTDSGGECGVLADGFIPMPWESKDKPWFSFDIGPIHIVLMDSEHGLHPTLGPEQRTWLEKDLKSVDRESTPWVVLGIHRPFYVDSNYRGTPTSDWGTGKHLRAMYEDLLIKYKVDLVIQGHNHAVQRTAAVARTRVVQEGTTTVNNHVWVDGTDAYVMDPVTKKVSFLPAYSHPRAAEELENGAFTPPGERVVQMHTEHVNPGAPIYILAGTGGAGFTVNYNTKDKRPQWSKRVFYRWGYGRATANASTLVWEWVDAESGLDLDTVVIRKDKENRWPWYNWAGIAVGIAVAVTALGAAGYFVFVRRGVPCSKHGGVPAEAHERYMLVDGEEEDSGLVEGRDDDSEYRSAYSSTKPSSAFDVTSPTRE